MERFEVAATPLWPVGHLPHKEGERQAASASPLPQGRMLNRRRLLEAASTLHPISPLEGALRVVAEGQKSMKSISTNEGLSASRAKADARTEGGEAPPASMGGRA